MLLQDDKRIRNKISALFADLMAPHIQRLDRVLSPGEKKLTWTSVGIDDYVREVRTMLSELDLLTDRANELVEFRIEVIFREITSTVLCELPSEESWTVEYFVDRTRVSSLFIYRLYI